MGKPTGCLPAFKMPLPTVGPRTPPTHSPSTATSASTTTTMHREWVQGAKEKASAYTQSAEEVGHQPPGPRNRWVLLHWWHPGGACSCWPVPEQVHCGPAIRADPPATLF